MVQAKTKKTESTNSSLSISLYDFKGAEVKKIDLEKNIFQSNINNPLLAQAVRVYLVNQRQGNASTKTRGLVVGSTRKIFRQKGTGRARHGDIKAPIFVGGGVSGGPVPKNYLLKINKKQKRQAFFGALSLKLKNKNIIALQDEALKTEPKTKNVVSFLKSVNLYGKKSLFVMDKVDYKNFILAIRNIKKVNFSDSVSLNTYQVLQGGTIIFFESALKKLSEHFLKNNK